jgi:hypothetical protein
MIRAAFKRGAKLDAATFERLASRRNFTPQTLEIARRLLVNGEPARELAHPSN